VKTGGMSATGLCCTLTDGILTLHLREMVLIGRKTRPFFIFPRRNLGGSGGFLTMICLQLSIDTISLSNSLQCYFILVFNIKDD
jgi:hypothetical protein